MAHTDNRTILEKADLALADLRAGNALKEEAAKRFLRLVTLRSNLLSMVTAPPMNAPKQEFPAIGFGERLLRPASPGVALTEAERAKPDFSTVELDTQSFKAEVDLTDEVLEDNLEGPALRQTVMTLIAEAVSRDIEELVLNGDTASADPFYATMDGLRKQAQSNVVDAAGVAMNADVLTDMLRTQPKTYLRDRPRMRFLTSINSELRYRRSLVQRETGVGDRVLETDRPVPYSGVLIEAIPLFPDNLGAGGDQTEILLLDPKNIYVGFWRKVRIETERSASAGALKIVVSLRFATMFAREDQVVKAINVAA